METYLITNLIFLIAPITVWLGTRPGWQSTLVLLLVLGTMTAIFDNAIIGAGIVAYNHDNTLNINVGLAPIEDFAYTLAAALGVPALWRIFSHED